MKNFSISPISHEIYAIDINGVKLISKSTMPMVFPMLFLFLMAILSPTSAHSVSNRSKHYNEERAISNEHHEWLKKRDWPAVQEAVLDPRNRDMLVISYEERDEHGRLPHHWLAEKAQTHTHILSYVGVASISLNQQALITRDNEGETPIDLARRSGACAEIIGLLSLTPEEARSLGGKEMRRLYAPVAHWMDEMVTWIRSRSYADCHKFIDEHDDELVREVLKYNNTTILNFFEMLLLTARNTASPSCFLLFE